jgi:hypothetical protein
MLEDYNLESCKERRAYRMLITRFLKSSISTLLESIAYIPLRQEPKMLGLDWSIGNIGILGANLCTQEDSYRLLLELVSYKAIALSPICNNLNL